MKPMMRFEMELGVVSSCNWRGGAHLSWQREGGGGSSRRDRRQRESGVCNGQGRGQQRRTHSR